MRLHGLPIVEEYVRLALSIDQHRPGYVDAYFGPPEWREQVTSAGLTPLPEMTRRAKDLSDAIVETPALGSERKTYLLAHVHAMQASLSLLSGESMNLVQEVEALYDVTPFWTDEAQFEEAHQLLDDLLPPGNSLVERMVLRKQALEVSVDVVKQLLPYLCHHFRERTRRLVPLPEQESFDVEFVDNKPWAAYNWYLGRFRSRIDINTDLPMRIDQLADLLAHEAYPGHHTELAIKEARLIEEAGYGECTVLTINSPSCVVSEGIATCALNAIFTIEELIVWQTEELFPRAGMQHLDAEREAMIHQAGHKLVGIGGNAVFMLHDRGANHDSVSQYLQHFGLLDRQQADKRIEFYRNPLYRSYIFTYHLGKALVDDLLAQTEDASYWYARLLAEAVTPTQIRQWIALNGNG